MKRRQRRNYRETTQWEMVAIHFMKFKLFFLFIELEKCSSNDEKAKELHKIKNKETATGITL